LRKPTSQLVALVASLLLLAVGCAKPSSVRKQSAGNDTTTASSAPASTGSPGKKGVQAAGTLPGANESHGGAGGGTTASGPQRVSVPPVTQRPTVGVTAKTIKLGFIIVSNNDKVTSGYGVKGAAIGDTKQQVQAVVDDINSRGGILGRKVDAKIRTLDAQADGPTAYSQLCAGFTQDDKVFAVLAPWNPDPSFAPCLAKTGTFYISDALLQYDAESFKQYAPYVVSGVFSSSRGSTALVTGLYKMGFFKGAKVGIVRNDNPIQKRVYEKYVKPTLTKFGVKVAAVYAATGTTASNDAASYMKAHGADHVVFISAAGGTALFFMNFAQSQGYFPKYGLASPDSPAFQAQNAPYTQLRGAKGVGWVPGFDVLDSEGPPLSANEKRCLAVHKKGGTDYGNSRVETAAVAMAWCDMAWLFEETAIKAGHNLTKLAWANALAALGTSHHTTMTFATNFSPGGSDGAVSYRPMTYDESPSCRCFRYSGPPVSIGR
jgi:ABC-type branched-subunit amino acid transport system substrate-binding protein